MINTFIVYVVKKIALKACGSENKKKPKNLLEKKYKKMINEVWKHMNVTREDKWKKDELQEMNRKTRKLKTMNKKLHPRSDVAQLHWKNGGKGLIGCENSVKSEKMA